MQSFMKIKPLRNGKNTLSFIDIGKPGLCREFFTLLICLLLLFAKNKILTKIYESTVVNSKGADQTAWMLRLVCAFVVHIQQSQVIPHRGPYYK